MSFRNAVWGTVVGFAALSMGGCLIGNSPVGSWVEDGDSYANFLWKGTLEVKADHTYQKDRLNDRMGVEMFQRGSWKMTDHGTILLTPTENWITQPKRSRRKTKGRIDVPLKPVDTKIEYQGNAMTWTEPSNPFPDRFRRVH